MSQAPRQTDDRFVRHARTFASVTLLSRFFGLARDALLGRLWGDSAVATAFNNAFQVPNTLTGEGNLPVDITFESMEDFSPAAIAKKVEPLAKLLDARTQLSNLLTYMDGKSGAEELISKVLADPALLQALVAAPQGGDTPAGDA